MARDDLKMAEKEGIIFTLQSDQGTQLTDDMTRYAV